MNAINTFWNFILNFLEGCYSFNFLYWEIIPGLNVMSFLTIDILLIFLGIAVVKWGFDI